MIKRWIHNRERYLAMLNDNRVVSPFEWGTEFISKNANGGMPRDLFLDYSKKTIASSDDFFFAPQVTDFRQDGGIVTWTSGVETPSIENNTAYARLFPYEKDKKAAVVILPHWNA